jgi:hypothetical protein
MPPTIIHRTKVYPLIKSTKGQLFSVTFVKKDGELREMVAQLRPPKLDAKRPSPAKENNPYVLVGDMGKYLEVKKDCATKQEALDKSYRLINIATILRLRIGGVEYKVEG